MVSGKAFATRMKKKLSAGLRQAASASARAKACDSEAFPDDSDGDGLVPLVAEADAIYNDIRALVARMRKRPLPAKDAAKYVKAINGLVRRVRSSQPRGFRWHTAFEGCGLKAALEPFTKHVSALLANKSRDVINFVGEWASFLNSLILRMFHVYGEEKERPR